MGVVALNGIRFDAPDGWRFHSFERLILGRPDTGAAVVQISSAFKDDLVGAASHDSCTGIAREFAGAGDDLFDVATESPGTGLFGGFSLHKEDQLIRTWYRCQDGKLIVGNCACSWDNREKSEVARSLLEAGDMIRSASYKAV